MHNKLFKEQKSRGSFPLSTTILLFSSSNMFMKIQPAQGNLVLYGRLEVVRDLWGNESVKVTFTPETEYPLIR